jgi:hypothetical protein
MGEGLLAKTKIHSCCQSNPSSNSSPVTIFYFFIFWRHSYPQATISTSSEIYEVSVQNPQIQLLHWHEKPVTRRTRLDISTFNNSSNGLSTRVLVGSSALNDFRDNSVWANLPRSIKSVRSNGNTYAFNRTRRYIFRFSAEESADCDFSRSCQPTHEPSMFRTKSFPANIEKK